ncbi:MAG: type-F conjugative transfer system pilin assembly protein TrbC [Burkholderiales bacterium]|nr:type-F conjugative transfer system pilin assembly protein TrbC [Burkholderiales bacterium]
MRLLIIFFTLVNVVYADQVFTYSRQQAAIAESQARLQVEAARQLMPQMSAESTVLTDKQLQNQRDVDKLAIEQSKNKIDPIALEVESGEKYYIFSDKLKSDINNMSKQFKEHPPLDFNQTLTYYNELSKNSKTGVGNNKLLIFISYSMPKDDIVKIIKQAEPIGAVFVFRGMINGSMKQTQKEFISLKKNYQVGAMINPKLYTAFNITRVPSFVVYDSSGSDLLKEACNVTPNYTKVAGDVSVRFALETLRRSNQSGLGKLASNYLDLLDSSGLYKK